MLDIKFVRENPEVVKQNIRNKFQQELQRTDFPDSRDTICKQKCTDQKHCQH